MRALWDAAQRAYLRLVEPLADVLIRNGVSPNVITTFGTLCTVASGVVFATGHIRTAGWVLGVAAVFDVLDGTVARRTGRTSVFGAFYDSTLDRIADGAILGGLLVFYASNTPFRSLTMVVICLAGVMGAFLTSYTRARAEALGISAKVGMIQRPERIVLLAVPQAFFGLALDGRVLGLIVAFLALTSWVTVVQRISFVHRATRTPAASAPDLAETPAVPALTGDRVVP